MENTKRKRKKFNNSKYRFHLLKVGETFKVKSGEAHAMRCSLDSFNKRHQMKIEIFIDDFSNDNEYEVTRIK